MNFNLKVLIAFLSACLTSASFSHAATVATDNAADAAYSGGWTAGSNGGTGWGGGWQFSSNPDNNPPGSRFIGSSTTNGDGDGDVNGDIDTLGSTAWGLYGEQTLTHAYRPFDGSLNIGQRFVIFVDTGFVDAPTDSEVREVGFLLQNDAFETRLQFLFKGDGSSYDVTTIGPTAIPFTDEGLKVRVRVIDADHVKVVIIPKDGTKTIFNNVALSSTPGSGITGVDLVNYNSGSGASRDVFFNNMRIKDPNNVPAAVGLAVVPEPSSFALVGVAALGAVSLLRRKR